MFCVLCCLLTLLLLFLSLCLYRMTCMHDQCWVLGATSLDICSLSYNFGGGDASLESSLITTTHCLLLSDLRVAGHGTAFCILTAASQGS